MTNYKRCLQKNFSLYFLKNYIMKRSSKIYSIAWTGVHSDSWKTSYENSAHQIHFALLQYCFEGLLHCPKILNNSLSEKHNITALYFWRKQGLQWAYHHGTWKFIWTLCTFPVILFTEIEPDCSRWGERMVFKLKVLLGYVSGTLWAVCYQVKNNSKIGLYVLCEKRRERVFCIRLIRSVREYYWYMRVLWKEGVSLIFEAEKLCSQTCHTIGYTFFFWEEKKTLSHGGLDLFIIIPSSYSTF